MKNKACAHRGGGREAICEHGFSPGGRQVEEVMRTGPGNKSADEEKQRSGNTSVDCWCLVDVLLVLVDMIPGIILIAV